MRAQDINRTTSCLVDDSDKLRAGTEYHCIFGCRETFLYEISKTALGLEVGQVSRSAKQRKQRVKGVRERRDVITGEVSEEEWRALDFAGWIRG